jgi:aminopeptidase
MADPRIEKLADMLVNYSVAVQPGQKVVIQGPTLAEPLIKATYVKVLQAGGHPLVMAELPGLDELTYRYSSDEQLKFVHEPYRQVVGTYDVQIGFMADSNTKELNHIDPQRIITSRLARRDLMKTFMRRAGSGELKWTLTLFPTQAHAQEAEMSLSDYEDFVYSACMPDLDDPIGYWRRFSAHQERIVTWLKGNREVHVTGPETDLHLSVAGRRFINCDCHYNVPDGEVFTGPVENSLEGHVYYSYPAIYNGREVTGVRLWFEHGKVVKASAEKNEEYLLKTLDTDEGARYVGEFAIGTNEGIKQFTGEILFDEKIGGSFHMALGNSYPETGGVNESAIHWDMICDLRQGGEIRVDGELFYQNGQFRI